MQINMADKRKTTTYLFVHENGDHTVITREKEPDSVHVARAGDTLARQNVKGYYVRLEGDLRTDGRVVLISDVNGPTAGFEAAVDAFKRKGAGAKSNLWRFG